MVHFRKMEKGTHYKLLAPSRVFVVAKVNSKPRWTVLQVFFINYLVLNGPITQHGQKPVNGGHSGTSEVVQDVLSLLERRLALLRRLLGQSFGGVGSSEQLIGRLLHRKRKQFCVLRGFFSEKLPEALNSPAVHFCLYPAVCALPALWASGLLGGRCTPSPSYRSACRRPPPPS